MTKLVAKRMDSVGPLPESLEVLAVRTRVTVGEALYSAGDNADAWYRVIAGAACECVQTVDGRRQIVDFLLPGDLFGFCARFRHESSVEIIADETILARYPRRQAEELVTSDPEVALAIRERAFESIARLKSRMVLLGRTNALEKVSAFLLEMSEREPLGVSDDVALAMSRYDIADYLALAVETVSRALTTLKAEGAITLVNSRQVRIMDRRYLYEAIRTPPYGRVAVRHRRCEPPSTPGRQEMRRASFA